MSYDINTIDELVLELGGPTIVGRWLDIRPEAVSMWKIRNHIPPGWHTKLAASVARKGKRLNPSVFGLSEEDVRGLWAAA